jgi:hypothetical protein
MLNVHKSQLIRPTGSRNLTGPKRLRTIQHTYMKLVTRYQIPVINSCLEKCDEKILGTYGRTDGRTEATQYNPQPLRWSGNIEMIERGKMDSLPITHINTIVEQV